MALRVRLVQLPGADGPSVDAFASDFRAVGVCCETAVVSETPGVPIGAQLKSLLLRAIAADTDFVVTVGTPTVASNAAAAFAKAFSNGSDVIAAPSPVRTGVVKRAAASLAGVDPSLAEAAITAYNCAFVAGVPFERCDRGDRFEWELHLQLRAHGALFKALAPGLAGARPRVSSGIAAIRPAIRARLHAFGAFIDDRMPPDPEYRYHQHPRSSHGIILHWLTGGQSGRRLLDVGAGSGQFAKQMVAAGFDVTCLEGVPERAAACARVTTTHNVDLDESFHIEGDFDVIVLADVLEHLRMPDLLVERLRRHLSADGVMVISVPNVANIFVRLFLLLGMFPYGRQGILDRTHVRFFTAHSLDRLLTQAGLEIAKRGATPVPFFLLRPEGWVGAVVGGVEAVYVALVRIWPALFAYQFLRIARPFPEHR